MGWVGTGPVLAGSSLDTVGRGPDWAGLVWGSVRGWVRPVEPLMRKEEEALASSSYPQK